MQRKTVRVVIDAHMLGSGETGNETYIANLLPNLSGLIDEEYAAAVMPNTKLPPDINATDLQLLPLRPSGNWMRLVYTLPTLCQRWRAEILHVTYVGPFVLSCPLVVSLHDVAYKRYPAFFSPRDRLLFSTLMPLTLRRASAVITLSEHAKREVLGYYPYLNGKVHVTHLAPNTAFRPIAEPELLHKIRARYGIHSDFILAVGNLQPRKNLPRLIRAFASIRNQIESIRLVIVGNAQWQASVIFTLVSRLGLEQDVVFTGYIPNDDLVLLYNAAKVFVYPSIYEGFGLPILEAMACGTPVVTSNSSSMPEVAGDAALFVDPHDEGQLADTIQQVLTNPDLALSLVEKGIRQTQQFSWRYTAAKTEAAYRAVFEA